MKSSYYPSTPVSQKDKGVVKQNLSGFDCGEDNWHE